MHGRVWGPVTATSRGYCVQGDCWRNTSTHSSSRSWLSRSDRREHDSWSETKMQTPPPFLFRSWLKTVWKFGRLKRQCHDSRWFLAAILFGENNGGHKARPRKTIFARLSLGGEVVHAADGAVMVRCPRHLREQSPLLARSKKSAKNHWISWHCPLLLSLNSGPSHVSDIVMVWILFWHHCNNGRHGLILLQQNAFDSKFKHAWVVNFF